MTIDLAKPLQFDCCYNAGTAFQIHDGQRQIAIVEVADPEGQPYYEDIPTGVAYAKLFTASPDLLELAKRYRHLLSELYAGNAFSKDYLWRTLNEAAALIAKAGAP